MIKIIKKYTIEDLEEEINSLTCEISSINITAISLHDVYDRDGSICNQWIEYIATIVTK